MRVAAMMAPRAVAIYGGDQAGEGDVARRRRMGTRVRAQRRVALSGAPVVYRRHGSGRRRRTVAVLCLAVAGVLAWAPAPAALIMRGHVFGSSFEGTGEHELRDPAGVAVAEATGEVFVSDRMPGHEGVERFKPNGAGGYEFVSAFKVKSPEELAVDNSASEGDPSRGDVYVVGAEEEGAGPTEHNVLYKYDPATGKVVFKKTIFHAGKAELELAEVYGVAVDAAGTVWVYSGEEGLVSGFNNLEVNRWQPSLAKELNIVERFGCRARPGFAVSGDHEAFYVAHEQENGLEECREEEATPTLVAKFAGSGEPVARGLDGEPTTGVAVDPVSGSVYADNVGSIAAFSSGGSLIQRFGSGSLSGGGATAVDAKTDEVYVAEPDAGKVEVFAPEGSGPPSVDSVYTQSLTPASERVVAQIDPHGSETSYYVQYGTVSCVVEPSSCADVPALPGAVIGSGFGDATATVELQGLVPNTSYFYRVLARNADGTAESPQSTKTFFTTLPSAEGVLADHRAWELVSPPEKHGAAIESISKEGALIQASAGGNAITWTASSPVASEPEGNRRPEPGQVLSTRDESKGWSSKDITTPHNKGEGYLPFAETEYRYLSPDLSLALVEPQVQADPLESPPLAPGATEKTMYRRDSAGEFEPLVTAANAPTGEKFGGKLEFRGASADLSYVVFESQVPLITGAAETGLYEWESGAALKLVSVLPGAGNVTASEPALGDQGRDVRGAISSDGGRVFWTQGGSDEGPLYMRNTVAGNTVQVNAAQGEGVKEPSEAERGEGLDEVHFQAAAHDGSRVFFTDAWPLTSESTLEPRPEETVIEGETARNAGRPADLYEFDVETGKLLDLTVDNRVGENADVLGTLPGISEDGSYVYFVANGALAPGAEPGNCPRTEPKLPHPQAACNLYVSEPDPEHPGKRETRFIARLSYQDAGDWGQRRPAGGLFGSLGGVTSEVSENGRYLAFMSQMELTGYHNIDANPEAKGAHDQEVFIYDRSSGRLSCASCNPSGAPPRGVFDTEEAGEGLGLVVDRPETWKGEWLAGSIPGWTSIGLTEAERQARYLSNGGRLFFNAADALVSQVATPTREEEVNGSRQKVGVENVYEYEPEGLGSCTRSGGCVALVSSGTSAHESAFLDASQNGNDVFFLTSAQLVAQDTDNAFDVYDARVCGTPETQACLPAQPSPPLACTGEECRPQPSPQPGFTPPATSTFSGPGNTSHQGVLAVTTKLVPKPKPLTRAQKLARALKLCRKIRQKHRRSACEAHARKTYRPKASRTHAKRSSSRRRTGP